VWKDLENTEENCETYGRNLKWYGRIVSRIVIRYGQYGRKASWNVKWYEIYGRKLWNDMENMEEMQVE
jgi:hypothetical protein